jgi:glycosyltransferase involved in cell wall biosynthesis
MNIVHVANINLDYESGMGRIASCWKDGFEAEGHTFYHIGRAEVPQPIHRNLWGYAAKKYLDNLALKPDVVIVHEPMAGYFASNKYKLILYSHGVEQRAWEVQKKYNFNKIGFKSKLIPVFFRYWSNSKGFKKADLILLSNNEDVRYLENEKGIDGSKIKIFKNGYYPLQKAEPHTGVKFLYNATWLNRKGKFLMYRAFNDLLKSYPQVNLILAGTSQSVDEVLNGFNKDVWQNIKVIPRYNANEEYKLYQEANIFVLPSYIEGQSVALTQAMAMGLCPVAANNCGQADFIQPNKNGLLFTTGDAEDFKNKMELLVNNNEKITEYGNNAAAFVKDLTWQNVTNEIIGYCKALAGL